MASDDRRTHECDRSADECDPRADERDRSADECDPRAREPTVGAIVRDGGGRLLLIRRGRAPDAGRWSIPGGHVERGESDEAAVVREVREETSLTVAVDELAGRVEIPAGERVFDNRDYLCRVIGGSLRAGDDAADARWCTVDEARCLPMTDGLLETLAAWGVLGVATTPPDKPPAHDPDRERA